MNELSALPPNFPHAKLYDLTLPAGGRDSLAIVGDFLRLRSASGLVNVRTDTGVDIDLDPGMGWRDFPYKRLEFLDKSGAANSIKLYAGGAEVVLETNPVLTAPGDFQLVRSGMAYWGQTGIGPQVGSVGAVQVYNNSTDQVLVVQGIFALGTAPFSLANSGVVLLTGSTNGLSMLTGLSAGVGQVKIGYDPAVTSQFAAISQGPLSLPIPHVLTPGRSLTVLSGAANAAMTVGFNWYQRPL